tara:strand:+ start:280 stop:1377 length:1098 start_codon:yes stop_codon:yes gene_type:complete
MNNHKMIKHLKSFFYGNLKHTSTLNPKKTRLIVVDVGSTGGLENKWQLINKYLDIYSFDPDSRSIDDPQKNNINFPYALWSYETKKDLNLTKFPDASSMFKPNENVLKKYLNHECHEIVKVVTIPTQPLEKILNDKPAPDFIKVDAEGAELEILKGSHKFLGKNVLGIEVEVQFQKRNIDAPSFSEVNSYIQSYGYQLISLEREHWIRKNNLWNLNSRPQIIWANCVYLIDEDLFIKKYIELSNNDRKILLEKIILISLVYGFYDYAFSILEKIIDEVELINIKELKNFQNLIKKNIRSNFNIISINLIRLIIALLIIVPSSLTFKYRERAILFLKNSIANLFYSVYSYFSRSGPKKVAISDGLK